MWTAPFQDGEPDPAVEQAWWLSPVPPPGPLRVVVRCADLGIGETAVELDGAAIAAAVDDVVTLWPWEPRGTRLPSRRPRPRTCRPTAGSRADSAA